MDRILHLDKIIRRNDKDFNHQPTWLPTGVGWGECGRPCQRVSLSVSLSVCPPARVYLCLCERMPAYFRVESVCLFVCVCIAGDLVY